ncbi:MAG: hypothetical protein KKB50_18940 [Planctomycetes bacterium]|nr:hypothetical protein [Planctomycetota bacterium]
MNQVLMKFFKLPPAMRMILAVAGFGSLASIVFFVLPSLRSREARLWIVIVLVSALVLVVLILLIRRYVFGKKSSKLSGALESQGPTRGDIAEQEQIYREKFRTKLADLKSNGLSVYKLPWFVLVGEPGCGKTASLIHSGLDFPLGKDEVPGFGGTRNYNWWFSNDAVILDTAGRIAFQEEGTTDKVEWEYFLKLLRANRPRCPVNGVVIAIPADRLLRDTAEERAQKATVLRERLRQVHQGLGVRFPTFVLVTKMDLVGGFNEFFEEIRVDLQQRNQMFGWSRPGEFQEPYDPAGFTEAFDNVYFRLRDWGMRYLQRKATDEELGLIVTYPESFRALRDPLNDYICTVFQKSPLLEPPFFRGFYFTSAIQEGAPIFDVFTRTRTGRGVAPRPTKAVDSKAFFIHDLYGNKVFAEHGLIFRSAKHVTLNKRMRRMVWAGSGLMTGLMLACFFLGCYGVSDLITGPREDCRKASEAIQLAHEAGVEFDGFSANLDLAAALQAQRENYKGLWPRLCARALFIGADIDVPRDYVQEIHARYVLDCTVRPVVDEVEARLAEEKVAGLSGESRNRYLAALTTYTKWYGEMVGQEELPRLTDQEAAARATEYEALLTYLSVQGGVKSAALAQFEDALGSLAEEPRSFAADVLPTALSLDRQRQERMTNTLRSAIKQIAASWKPLTQLETGNQDPFVRYWAEFAVRVGELRDRYHELLTTRDGFRQAGQYPDAVQRFLDLTEGVNDMGVMDALPKPGTLAEAYYNLVNFLKNEKVPETEVHRVRRLGDMLAYFAEQWNAEFDPLEEALVAGAPDRVGDPQNAVYQALSEGRGELEAALLLSLAQVRESLGLKEDQEPLDYYANQLLVKISEAQPPRPFDKTASVSIDDNALGTNERLKQYLVELRALAGGGEQELEELQNLEKWPALLERMAAGTPPGEALAAWYRNLSGLAGEPPTHEIVRNSGLADRPFWEPAELYALSDALWNGRKQFSVRLLMERMVEKCAASSSERELPGLARLLPGFDDPDRHLPFDRHRFNVTTVAAPTRAPEQTAEREEPEREGELPRLRRQRDQQETPDVKLGRSGPTELLAKYHTRAFLLKVLRAHDAVQAALQNQPGTETLRAALDRAAHVYIDSYFQDWHGIYTDPTRLLDEGTLTLLEKCRAGQLSWPEYVEALTGRDAYTSQALADRMVALVREAVMFEYDLDSANPNAAVRAREDRIYDLIADRLSEVNRAGHSLPHLLKEMISDVNRPDQGTRETAFAGAMTTAWNNYVSQVRELGPLREEDAQSSSGKPPDLAKLAKEIVFKRATTTEFGLIKPLLDLAQYGQELLVHHLDALLAQRFDKYRAQYPIVAENEALDDSARLTRLSQLKLLPPRELLKLLQDVADFERRYGVLYANVRADSNAQQTLQKCRQWVEFLYNDPNSLTSGRDPDQLDVSVEVVKDFSGEFRNAGEVYYKLSISLPLLTEFDEKGRPIDRDTRSADGGILSAEVRSALSGKDPQYRWDLLPREEITFDRTRVAVLEKHPNAAMTFPDPAVGWDLAGDPWSLLLLLSADPDNRLANDIWKIPVRIEAGPEPVGFNIALRLGSSVRFFPGVIPPPDPPQERPKMTAAGAYLTPPPSTERP